MDALAQVICLLLITAFVFFSPFPVFSSLSSHPSHTTSFTVTVTQGCILSVNVMRLLPLSSRRIYIAIIYAPVIVSSSSSFERALFDLDPDESLFNDQLSLLDVNSWNQGFGLDSNELLADNALDPIIEFDSNLALAGNGYLDESSSDFFLADNDVVCGVYDAENAHLFGKVRRENLCRDPPLGQTDNQDQFDKDPFEEFKNLPVKDPLTPFPEDTQLCSRWRFDTSNTPVCKEEIPSDIVSIPFARACNLLNIDPGAAIFIALYWHLHPQLIESTSCHL